MGKEKEQIACSGTGYQGIGQIIQFKIFERDGFSAQEYVPFGMETPLGKTAISCKFDFWCLSTVLLTWNSL